MSGDHSIAGAGGPDPAFGLMSEHSIKAFKGWVLEALEA